MSDPLAVALEWLAATSAPNWLLVLALLTRPTTWAQEAKSRVGGVLDMIVPSGDSDGLRKSKVSETPDDDPRE